ncbi:germination protein M [Alkalihalobacillus xiaoxiensis]|uniref:Germination protein M n=1 Tax=Shouchella xiaoxiensis TaxID=766895 RepID=A0ABS2SSN4_9BACI|nr:GerMN domain-containing protein [Shouchella xiaoxiensis]MBM7838538.1 germination protein M [Shouchella xiaoxiensis]
MRKLVGISVPFIVVLTLTVGCSQGPEEPAVTLDNPPITYSSNDLEENEGDEANEELNQDEDEESSENEATPDTGTESQNMRELYLIDANGMVVPQTVTLPKTESLMKQSLEYLVVDGPLQDVLPNGFRGVIPAGTTVDVNHLKEDKIAIANFSGEFNDYNPDDEKQIFESITWTLTQFEEVDEVKIQINGIELEEMPMSETSIVGNLTRADGINLDSGDVIDMTNSQDVTLYFLSSHENQAYYVPVTRRVENVESELATAIEELTEGPNFPMSNLLTQMTTEMELLEEPTLDDGKVVLNFNEAIQTIAGENAVIAQSILDTIALTLTEQEGVEEVSIQVNGEDTIYSENGNVIETVVRPAIINAQPL